VSEIKKLQKIQKISLQAFSSDFSVRELYSCELQ